MALRDDRLIQGLALIAIRLGNVNPQDLSGLRLLQF
jgi:hypothetical protein